MAQTEAAEVRYHQDLRQFRFQALRPTMDFRSPVHANGLVPLWVFLVMAVSASPQSRAQELGLQHSPLSRPKIFTSFPTVAGDPAMSYKDHPDMGLAACSGCGAAGQVLVATG